MSEINANKFLTLLVGKCYHEFVINLPSLIGTKFCKKCKMVLPFGIKESEFFYNYTNDQIFVLEYMSNKMPDVLNKYLKENIFSVSGNYENKYLHGLFKSLNMTNLVKFLIDNPEWGIKKCHETEECTNCITKMISRDICDKKSREIYHPALFYALGKDEITKYEANFGDRFIIDGYEYTLINLMDGRCGIIGETYRLFLHVQMHGSDTSETIYEVTLRRLFNHWRDKFDEIYKTKIPKKERNIPNPDIVPPKYDIVSEGYDPDDKS